MSSGAQHVREALAAWLGSDPTARIVGEGVGRGGGHAGSTAGLPADRLIDTPVGDRSALGLGLGLALAGQAVCVELSSARGLLAAAEILADAGRLAGTPFQPALTVRVPVGGEAGPVVDPPVGALLGALPGVTVSAATAATAGSLLASLLGRGVHVLLEPRAELARRATARPAQPGQLAQLRPGTQITIAAAGAGVRAALEAADALAAEGIDAQVLDLVSLSPLDPALGQQVARTGRLLVVVPGDPGFAERAQLAALDSAFLHLESPLESCAPHAPAVADAVRRSVTY